MVAAALVLAQLFTGRCCLCLCQSPSRAGHTHSFGQLCCLLDVVFGARKRGRGLAVYKWMIGKDLHH